MVLCKRLMVCFGIYKFLIYLFIPKFYQKYVKAHETGNQIKDIRMEAQWCSLIKLSYENFMYSSEKSYLHYLCKPLV